jgi:flagellar basal-body rod modification protein FlgD
MSRIPSSFGAAGNQRTGSSTDAINNLDLDVFLKLMIKELQTQDPLNPLDNRDMLAQISQIREVGATDKLTQTLDSVLLGQNISSAANLIGTDVTALSDDGQNIHGLVSRVSISDGSPKLHIDLSTGAIPFSADGDIEAGTYSYRIVWENEEGKLFGIDLSGDKAVKTTGTPGADRSIVIQHLPTTSTAKQIYRTDASGTGEYRLVGTLNDGSQRTFVDTVSDDDRSRVWLTRNFERSSATLRQYTVSLKNIAGIQPTRSSAASSQQDGTRAAAGSVSGG